MSFVDELAFCSDKLLHVLNDSESERDQRIESIEQLIAERELLINRIKDQSMDNLIHHPKAQKIVEMEKEIQSKLTQLFDDVKIDLKNLNQNKRSQQSYSNPFTHVQTYDGRYYDKRK